MKVQLTLLISVLTLFGCSKESKLLQSEGDVDVNFSVSGIIDVENINDDLGLSNSDLHKEAFTIKNLQESRSTTLDNEVILDKKEYEGEDFDAIVSLVEIRHPQKQLSNKFKIGATSNMDPNIRYKVFIYNKLTGAFIGQINGLSGTSNSSSAQNTPFKISRNTEYTIVAFSWNNTTEPTITGSPTSNPTIATSSTNQELLYTKFDITTNSNLSFHIPIIFKRQRASFQVEIDSKGIFAPIRTIGASSIPVSYSQYASLNLVSGVFSSFTNANAGTTIPLTFNPAPATNAPLYSAVANQYFTYNTTTINGFTVNLGAIQLLLDNGNNTTTRDYAARQYTITTPITFERGKIKRVRIQLIATAKTLTNTSPRIRWAKTNLYYNPSATEAQGGQYRMRNHNSNIYSTATNEAVIANEYWNWNALTPGAGTTNTGTGDPCNRVYPIGTWRLPTNAELSDIFNPLTAINYAGSTDPARFMYRDGLAGTINGVNYDLEGSDRRVSFINYGFRNSATLNTPASISNFSSNGAGHGYYWSSTSVDANNGAVMKVVHNGASNQTANNGSTYNTSIVSLNKNFGASVRCVRTAANL